MDSTALCVTASHRAQNINTNIAEYILQKCFNSSQFISSTVVFGLDRYDQSCVIIRESSTVSGDLGLAWFGDSWAPAGL